MARLTVDSEIFGFDFRTLNFSNLYDAYDVIALERRYELFYYSDNHDEFRGYGFRYNDENEPTAGTVTQFRTYATDIIVTTTNLEIAATDIRDAARSFATRDDMRIIRKAFAGNDVLEGGGAGDRLSGYKGEDTIKGGAGADRLFGGDGSDLLRGEKGRDRLYGNEGDDTLVGGSGRDLLIGKDGADVFRFNVRLGPSNIDKIDDFAPGEDHIQLDDDVFEEAGDLGLLARAAFHLGANAHDGSDRIIYDQESGALFYDPDGTGAAEQIQFATLGRRGDLAAHDFEIIG